MAKWKDKQRVLRARVRAMRCIICGLAVKGCFEDDRCPATLLCSRHYWVQAESHGDVVGFGFAGVRLSSEVDLKDFERWRPMFEAAMKRRGLYRE